MTSSTTKGSDEGAPPRADRSRARRWAWFAALLLAAASAVVRVVVADRDPNFGHGAGVGLLKSDPALAFYLTDRIVESHGHAPDDLRADARVEHPEGADLAKLMPVGLEFLCAWTHLASGGGPAAGAMNDHQNTITRWHSLVITCVVVSAACASLTLIGVFGLALELTSSAVLALFAALLAACLPASYRTVGFILVDEDLALPFFALHLWLLARAFRVRTWTASVLAAIALAVSLASWHAAGFLASLEAACVLAWAIATGARPFRFSCAWAFPIVLAAAGLLVPMLRATGCVVSFPMLALLGLAVATRARARWTFTTASIATIGVLALAAPWIASTTGGSVDEHRHVFDLLWSKLRFLGELPEDPNQLSADARLMWQGPFATLDLGWGLGQLGVATLALPLSAWCFARRAPHLDARAALLALGACASLVAAWLVARVIVLPAILLPALAVAVIPRDRIGRAFLRVSVFAQLALFTAYAAVYVNPWYRPPQRQAEIAAMLEALPKQVPPGEAIAADFMNSTAILARTRHPIAFQPKWESRRSRARVVEFLDAFFHRSPAELRALLVGKYRCRYLLVDRFTLWFLARYSAGVPRSASEPPPGSAAAFFLSQDDATLRGVPGFTLLYRSPPTIVQSNGAPADFFRLYRLDP